MINVFSPKMINATGFVQKVFGVFSDNHISVDIISTSEANISVTVAGNQDISHLTKQLSEFAQVNEVDVDTVSFILNQYFCDTKQVTKESIRQRVSGMNLGLLKLTRLINNLLDFVKDMYDKFTAEGV